jgi:PEP-CTERM motif-containing protein
MKRFWLLSAGLIVLSGSMFGDVIGAGTGVLTNITGVPISTFLPGGALAQATYNVSSFPGAPAAGTPFWNNPSSDGVAPPPPQLADGHIANVGDVLAGLATGTNLIGTNLVGTPGGGGAPVTTTSISGAWYGNAGGNGDPSTGATSTIAAVTVNGGTSTAATELTAALEFSFQSQATAFNIALLFADSGSDTGSGPAGTIFGTYTETATNSGVFTLTPLTDPVDTTTGATTIATNDMIGGGAGAFYGFYATVCYHISGTSCDESVTYTTGAGNWSTNMASGNMFMGALGWNHFALFELASGEEVIGFTDTPFSLATNPLGLGDFNDLVVGLTGNPPNNFGSSAPEPGTIAIMGLGLAGLGLIGRRRFAKK